MALKLRKPTQEEEEEQPIALIPEPITEPVEVDLSDESLDAAPEIEVPAAGPLEPPEPSEPQEPDLRKRLADLEAAQARHQEELARERARAMEAERQSQQLQNRVNQSETNVFQAEYDGLTNTIGGARSEIDAAKRDLAVAREAGDLEAEATAIQKLSDAQWLLRECERRKAGMDIEVEARKTRPTQTQQPQTVEGIIAASGLPERAKSWLREHQDYVSDPAKNAKLQELHYVAKHQSGAEFTDKYFEKMEELLGFGSPSSPPSSPGASPVLQSQPAASGGVQAPPSRTEVHSMATGKTQSKVVTLNADEREIASTIAQSKGISQAEAEKEYARQKIKFQQMKQNGHYQGQ